MYYAVSQDNLSKIVSVCVVLLFTAITSWQVYLFIYSEESVPFWILIMIVGILLIILLISYLYKINGYKVDSNALIIERPFLNRTFMLSEILSVEAPSRESMRWTIRTFGNGGLFGYWGKFTNTTYGNMTWYATRRSNYIVIKIKGEGLIVVTPDDLSMADVLKEKIA